MTATFQLPPALKLAVQQGIGQEKYNKLNPGELKVAGAIAQAGIENEKGIFNIKRQAGFITFIEKQDISSMNLPDEVYRDMFDVLSGILLALSDLSPQTKESADLLYKNKLILYRILYLQPEKKHLCVFDAELLTAFQFGRMSQSENQEQVKLCSEFCAFLLHQDPTLSLSDLVGYDQKSRDFLLKQDLIKIWEALNGNNGRKGPPTSILFPPMSKDGNQVASYIRSRSFDEEEVKRGFKASIGGSLGHLKLGLNRELEKVEEESEIQSVSGSQANDLKRSINGLPPRSSHGHGAVDPKTIEQIQFDLSSLKQEMLKLQESSQSNKTAPTVTHPIATSEDLASEIAALKGQRANDLAEIQKNTDSLVKFKEQLQAVLKKIKDEFTANKNETSAQFDAIKSSIRNLNVDQASVKRPGSAITVDSQTLVVMQEKMEKIHLASLSYAEEVKQLQEKTLLEKIDQALALKLEQFKATNEGIKVKPTDAVAPELQNVDLVALKKDFDDTKLGLAKLKENVQAVVKKIKEEFTANKTEMQTALDNLQKDFKASPQPLSSAPIQNSDAPKGDLLVELAAIKILQQTSQTELQTKIQEVNGTVAKLKTNIQEILKKVKEEFTASKTETATSIESMTKEINELKNKSDSPVKVEAVVDQPGTIPVQQPNADLTQIKKETEETKTNLNKLKESVQNVVKKIKEEFTMNKTDLTSQIEGIAKELNAIKEKASTSAQVEVAGQVKQTEHTVSDIASLQLLVEQHSQELKKIKLLHPDENKNPVVPDTLIADLASLKKESEESKININKLKENVQTVIKKIKESFTQNQAETQTALENLQKEIKAGVHPVQNTTVVATEAPSNNLLVELAAIKLLQETSQSELKAKIEEANGSVAKLKNSIQEILKKVKEEFSANKTETASNIDGLKKEVNQIKENIALPVKPETAAKDGKAENPELSSLRISLVQLESEIKALKQSQTQSNQIAASYEQQNTELLQLKKDSEEAKTNVSKLKDSIQTVLKKIKEEFSANKTETTTSIDQINQKLSALQSPKVAEKEFETLQIKESLAQQEKLVAAFTQNLDDTKNQLKDLTSKVHLFTQNPKKKVLVSGGVDENDDDALKEIVQVKSKLELCASKKDVEQLRHEIEISQKAKLQKTSAAPTKTEIQTKIEQFEAQLEQIQQKITGKMLVKSSEHGIQKGEKSDVEDELKKQISLIQEKINSLSGTVETFKIGIEKNAEDISKTFLGVQSLEKKPLIDDFARKRLDEIAKETSQAISYLEKKESELSLQISDMFLSLSTLKNAELSDQSVRQSIVRPVSSHVQNLDTLITKVAQIEEQVLILKNLKQTEQALQVAKSKSEDEKDYDKLNTDLQKCFQEVQGLQKLIQAEIKTITSNALAEKMHFNNVEKEMRDLQQQLLQVKQKADENLGAVKADVQKLLTESQMALKFASNAEAGKNKIDLPQIQQMLAQEVSNLEKQITELKNSLQTFEAKRSDSNMEIKKEIDQCIQAIQATEKKTAFIDELNLKFIDQEIKTSSLTSVLEEFKKASGEQNKAIKKLQSDVQQKPAEPSVSAAQSEFLKTEIDHIKQAQQVFFVSVDSINQRLSTVETYEARIKEVDQKCTLQCDTLEKKLRGLQKKTKTDLDDRIGKQKAEFALMQSNQSIYEEKLKEFQNNLQQKPQVQQQAESALSGEEVQVIKNDAQKTKKKVSDLNLTLKGVQEDVDSQIQNQNKDIQGLILRMKKQELVSQTIQDILNASDAGRLPQISSVLPSLPQKKGHQMTTDQMKRLLALIENNAQANALQRETTMNILLRLELIEQTVKLISNTSNIDAGVKNSQQKEFAARSSRHNSLEKILVSGRESQDQMSTIEKRKKPIASAKIRSPEQSPTMEQESSFGKVKAFNSRDLSMYAAIANSARNANNRVMHRSIPPLIHNSSDRLIENPSASPEKKSKRQ